MNQNRILIISPRFFGYEEYLKIELNKLGYEPYFLDERLPGFIEKSITRIGWGFLLKKRNTKRIEQYLLETNKEFQIILFISPETTTSSEISILKLSNPNARYILYMWDSLKNKRASKILDLFDKILTFDYRDYSLDKRFNFLPLYFNPNHYKDLNLSKKYDLTLCCSLHSDRYQLFRKLLLRSKDEHLNFFYHIYVKNKWLLTFYRIKVLIFSGIWIKSEHVSYKSIKPEDLNFIYNKSKAVIDLNHPSQNGLTNRTFEVLATNTKLITTNESIKNYHFFDEDVIAVLDRKTLFFPMNFINKSKKKIDISDYKLDSWINNILK